MLQLKPLSLPKPAIAPPVIVIGEGLAVVRVGDMIRIDVTSDDGKERRTCFLSVLEAKQLVVSLGRLSSR